MNYSFRTWQVALQHLAVRACGESKSTFLLQKYQTEFSTEYQALVSPRDALQDILQLEQINATVDRVSLLKPSREVENFRLHFYSEHQRFLDEYIPILENLNLRVMDQIQFVLNVGCKTVFIRSFTVKAGEGQVSTLSLLRKRLLDAIHLAMAGNLENDVLNKLVVLAGLSWQDIEVLRAYRNYLLQIAQNTTRASIHHALLHNPKVALGLFSYFEARFRPDATWDDPAVREEQVLYPLRLQLLEGLSAVSSINDDRILRTLFNLIDATMRSNFHVRRHKADFFIAFKINSLGVIEMPAPKPQYEIYIHAVDMEGIHLRAGKISRGGIRWSDRPDDFRCEILGLMQTQISKNALIIPTGAKGGFVLKQNGIPLELKEAGKKAYLTLIRGLLDLTDNFQNGQVIKLPEMVAYDDPDPYLVVAADKGTAKFSDIANALALEYRFWLGDAFASGGSFGYDHKALGITARGAWECIKRHFRELGKNIQTEAFTVVGIGSMDGDVFGNAMLLSPQIQLCAAFSGQHIFIDPRPAPGDAAFNERRRLFELQGSSWNDYDRSLISSGGGVFSRSDKDITISPELRQWLNVRYKTLDGEALIRYLLSAPVDLLWLGGIGTYVKASSEKHEEVNDRTNDNVRIDASALRAKVVGEGANLGFTQKARIEYGLGGGHINTDAVDNSAGVDTSDHEVNLKIFLTGLKKQQLNSDYQSLFADMTDAVCDLVLADNIAQSLCLSLEQIRSSEHSETFLQLAENLENSGFLDRVVEFFPANKEITARPGQVLTRPELAVLMSASKRYLTHELEKQVDFLSAESTSSYLSNYFPTQLRTRFEAQFCTHPLANAIKATMISNKLINQAGSSLLNLKGDGASILNWISVYLTFDQLFQGDLFRQAIQKLDNKIAAVQQNQLVLLFENRLTELCRHALALNNQVSPDQQTLMHYSKQLAIYKEYYSDCGHSSMETFRLQLMQYRQEGIPEELMEQLIAISSLEDFPLAVWLADETGAELRRILVSLKDISDFLNLSNFYKQLAKFPKHDVWQRQVLEQLEKAIENSIALLIKKLLLTHSLSCSDYFEKSSEQLKLTLERYRKLYQEIVLIQSGSLLSYIVLGKALEDLVTDKA